MAQVKDESRTETGQGASAALRKGSETETGQRGGGHRAPAPALLSAEQESTGPLVGYAIAFGRSGDARSLPPSLASSETGEVNELNDDIERQISVGGDFRNQDATIRAAGGLSTKALATLPASTSFEGLADTDNGAALVNPSDSNGAVGPNHYVETVNNRVRVYNKSGVALTPPFRQSSLFASAGGLCATVDDGDPIVLYDKLADRWQISQFAFTATNAPPYHQCIAESVNGDPTGAYYVYDFVLPSNNFPDYPKLSTWPDAYYLSTRQFLNGGPFNGEGAIAFDRQKMLAGDPTATLIYFSNPGDGLSFSSSGMLPLDFDGVLPPAPGTPNIFAIYTAEIFGDPSGDALRLFDFHVDFAVPANSTFTERAESPIPVAAFDPLNPSGRGDVKQPPPSTPADNVDTIGDRLMYRLQYRNREGVESIVAVHTVNVGVHLTDRFPTPAEFQAAPRYYELQRSTPGGPFTIHDQATFSPDAGTPATGLNRWMGSAAIDAQGNLVVGYSTSSTSVFPSVSFAGRAFNETGGLLQGEATIFAGLGSQQASGNRWGDYSSLQLDPVDECTFWYVNEYYPVGLTQFNWHTRVGNFKFAGCTPPARGTIQGKVTDCVTGLPIVGALVQASDGHSAATGADGTYTISVPPGSYSVAASDSFRNCNPASPQNVSVSASASATANFCLSGGSKLDLGAVAIDDSLGNSNGVVNLDECIKLTVGIANDGCILDTNISATLSTSTPGVTVNQALSAYPNIAVNASANNTTPFAFTTSAGFVCGTPIDFAFNVTSDHQPAHTLHFTVPTCAGASQPFSGSLTASDSLQTARLGRDGNASGCAAPKGCPGALGAGSREYDLFTFPNSAGSTVCLKIDLTAGCVPSSNTIMAGAYLDSFDPSTLCLNYLGDPGGSPSPSNSFSVNVPAGHNLVLNVHEINAGLAGCTSYNGQVSGFIDDAPANGACPACALATTVAKSSLWPPNHNLINVGLAATSTGICPANRVVTVYSDEDDVNPSTGGDQSPDAKNVALGTLRLRAEQQDSGAGADGRVYLIVTRTSDGTGNGAFSCQTVTVPKNQSAGEKNSVAAQAAAALTFCTNNGGTAPAGYFVVGDGPVIGPKQ